MKIQRLIYPYFIQIIITLAFLSSLFFLSSCKKPNNTPVETTGQFSLFPEFFIERGSDSDSSYISLRGVRVGNDTLEIQATSWGIIEYGLILVPQNSSKSILYSLVGECGTVMSKTSRKVTLSQSISPETQDTLQQVGFTNFRDTLIVTKTSTTEVY